MNKTFKYRVQIWVKGKDRTKNFPFAETIPMEYDKAVKLAKKPYGLFEGVVVPVMEK